MESPFHHITEYKDDRRGLAGEPAAARSIRRQAAVLSAANCWASAVSERALAGTPPAGAWTVDDNKVDKRVRISCRSLAAVYSANRPGSE